MEQIKIQKSKVDEIFAIARVNKNEHVILFGNNLVSSKKFKSIKDAENYIEQRPYEILINVSVALFNELQKNEIEKTISAKENAENTKTN